MGNLFIDEYWFFVPLRLIWSHMPEFFGENTQTAWTPSVTYVTPKTVIPSGGWNIGTIADHLYGPVLTGAGRKINALPLRAYALIMNEWFRDENLMTPVHVSVGDSDTNGSNGSDQVTDIEKGGAPFIAARYFDLFSSSIISPQKGPAATFSLAGFAPVMVQNRMAVNYNDVYVPYESGQSPLGSVYGQFQSDGTNWLYKGIGSGKKNIVVSNNELNIDNTATTTGGLAGIAPMNLWADLSSVTQFNVNELRNAFAVQRYYEALARGGSRYIEQVREFFGVNSSDYRFMRPEFLGAQRTPVNISQVTQTSETTSNSPLGDVAGLSVTGDANSLFTKSFTEHGIIMGIQVARYDHVYQQGVNKYFLKDEIWDFYNPKFANIGEQPVYKDEIYYGASDNDTVWGYNEAWYDYRFRPNFVTGELRSQYTTPLDMWHLGDYYASAPSLSASWLREDKSNLDRALAVTSEVANQLVCDYWFDMKAARPLPAYSIPGLIDHH